MQRRQLVCNFCHLSEENRKTGPLLRRNTVVVHENCLLYSSDIYSKNTPDMDDLYGIDEQDIIKEIRRGRKLKCYNCKKSGATIGCELPKCKKSYHYLCALKDGAQPFENISNGDFRLYCRAHRPSSDKEGPETPDAEELERGDQIEDSEEEIPSKRTKMSTPKSRAKRRSGQLDDSDSSDSGRRQEFPSEQGPVETDSEDGANPGQNVVAEADNNSDDDLDCTQLDRAADADEPRPSTSGNQVTSNGKFDDTDSEQGSESLLPPIKIIEVQSLCPPVPGHSHNTQVSSVESSFWAKCQEAGCIESVFSTFISSMKELSERMVSKQASEKDCILSFKVLKASGMLPDILAQIEQDMNGKLKTLQKETESLQMALSAIGSASKLCSSKETIKPEMSSKLCSSNETIKPEMSQQ